MSNLENHFDLKLVAKHSEYEEYYSLSDEFESTCFCIQSRFSYVWLTDIIVTKGHDTNSFNLKYYFINVEKFHFFSQIDTV